MTGVAALLSLCLAYGLLLARRLTPRGSAALTLAADFAFLAAVFLYVAYNAGDIPFQLFYGLLGILFMKSAIDNWPKVAWRIPFRKKKGETGPPAQ